MVTALDPAGHFAPLPPAAYDFDLLARWLQTQDVQVRSVTGATITSSTIQTATSGKRVVLGAEDSFITFYDSTHLLGYVGTELTGWGPSWLTIQTPGSVDGISIDADGVLHLQAQGSSGQSVWISGRGNGGIPGEVLGVYDSYTPAQIASFSTAGLGTSWIWLGNQVTAGKYTDTMWLTAQNIELQVWDGAATPTTLYNSVVLTDALIDFYLSGTKLASFGSGSFLFGPTGGDVAINFANPGKYTWTNDTDTYMGWVSANVFRLVAGGAETLRVFANTLQADDGSTGLTEIFPKGTLVVAGNYTNTTDYTNVPNANTLTHSTSIALEYAAQAVYVDVTVKVRWKGMTAGSYVYCRPYVGTVGKGLVCIDEPDTNSVGHLTQTVRWVGSAVADGSGNLTLGTECRSLAATADVEEVQIDYVIWRL